MPLKIPLAIIFDIGRVLVRVDMAAATAPFVGLTPLTPQEIWLAIEKHPRWRDWQEGRLSPLEWHRQLGQRLGEGLSFAQFSEAWNRALSPDPVLRDQLLEHLSRNYRLAVLSNTDPLHVDHLEANFPLLRHFPRRIYSCRVGATKPDPFVYNAALHACGVGPEQALYIDDVPAFVEAAVRLGMAGIVFESASQLENELRSRGILANESSHLPRGSVDTKL